MEGLNLRRGDGDFEQLRLSVAEPVAPSRSRSTKALAKTTVNWPAFRGENADGVGDGVDTPAEWDFESGKGILWQAELPRLGNSSPVVWDGRIFLTTAAAKGVDQGIRTGLTGDGSSVDETVEHQWLVLAFDKATGRELWRTEVGRGVPLTKRHFKATQANSTCFYHDEAANDGEYIVLEGELESEGLRLPQRRAWYTHQDERHLGTDHLEKIRRLETGGR